MYNNLTSSKVSSSSIQVKLNQPIKNHHAPWKLNLIFTSTIHSLSPTSSASLYSPFTSLFAHCANSHSSHFCIHHSNIHESKKTYINAEKLPKEIRRIRKFHESRQSLRKKNAVSVSERPEDRKWVKNSWRKQI